MQTVDGFALARAATVPEKGLQHVEETAVLGVAVRLEADSPRLFTALIEAIADGSAGAGRSTLRVVFRTADAAGLPDLARPLQDAASADLLLLAGAGCAGRVDFGSRTAAVSVSPELIADPVRWPEVARAFVLPLVTRCDREPVHAAAIALGTTGLVLAAPSGTGKSTLAYAAARAGLHVLSEDAVYVQLEPAARVWGLSGPLFVTPDAVRWFPELADATPVRRTNGKLKIAVNVARPSVHALERTALCILDRGGSATAGVKPMSVAEAMNEVARTMTSGFDVFRHSIEPRLRALASAGAWRVELGDDPHRAVTLLADLLSHVAATPAQRWQL